MDEVTQELRQYVLAAVWALFNNDAAADVLTRLPAMPSMVTEVTPRPHRWDASRISGFDLAGSFSTAKVMAMDFGGGKFEDRYDVITAYVTPDDRPEHLGARVSAQGQPGMTVTSICVEAETLNDPPSPPDAALSARPSAPLPEPVVESPDPPSSAVQPTSPEPIIGGIEPVPTFDLAGLIDDRWHRQIEVMRDFENFEKISVHSAADPTVMHFGLPPSWAPLIRLGTNGMTIGLMIDAPELGFVDERACLYEFGNGLILTDARVNALNVVWRSVTEERNHIEQSGDADALAAWLETATQFSELMGWTSFAPSGLLGFSWGDKRRKPERAPKRTKWRTDAGGNGVLAELSTWGDDPVRKPRSIAVALDKAQSQTTAGAPAHALHLLREALVIANRTNDAAAATAVYQAMVEPLEQLGRVTAAARSNALGSLG